MKINNIYGNGGVEKFEGGGDSNGILSPMRKLLRRRKAIEKPSAKQLVDSFQRDTTAHGIPNVARSRGDWNGVWI